MPFATVVNKYSFRCRCCRDNTNPAQHKQPLLSPHSNTNFLVVTHLQGKPLSVEGATVTTVDVSWRCSR